MRFKTPANFYVCGQTQAGKSHFTRCMLRHLEELFYPTKIIYCYGEYQKKFDKLPPNVELMEGFPDNLNDMVCGHDHWFAVRGHELPPNVELMEGFPDNLNDMVRGHDHSLVVLDDLMSQCSNDQSVAGLFTRGSHHRGISVLYLTQNLFPPCKLSRTISLNSHYFVIFRNPRDSLGISTLAKQMFPGRTDYLMESFRDATSRPYGYLVIDCHQLTPENMRLRTNILPRERQIAYVKRT